MTSFPSGINCGVSCAAPFDAGTVVTLTATAAAESIFSGWTGGGCSGTGTCSVSMTTTQAIAATFAPTPDPEFVLTLATNGAGTGTVTSSPSGINCGATCAAAYAAGTAVTLTAIPGVGSTFAGWSGGGCAGTGSCTVTLTSTHLVTASFEVTPTPQVTLTAIRGGEGTGTVTSSPAGISCGVTCSATYDAGTVVTLTATPASGSTFDGWTGGGCSGTGLCQVTMSADQTVTALLQPIVVGPRAYVANWVNATVSVIDVDTNTVIATIPVGEEGEEVWGNVSVAITPDGTRAYVGNVPLPFPPGPFISVIDVATNTVIARISGSTGVGTPAWITITPDGTRAMTGSGGGTVFVLDLASHTNIAQFQPPTSGFIAITPDGTRAYAAPGASHLEMISGIDLGTYTVRDPNTTTPIDLQLPGGPPQGASHLAITPDGTRAYTANSSSDTVSVIALSSNLASHTIIAIIPVGEGPSRIAITPDGTRAYVANGVSDTVSMIEVANNTVSATIPVGDQPRSIAITPDGTRAYVTNVSSDTVSVIDVATNTVIATIPVGGGPDGIAITP